MADTVNVVAFEGGQLRRLASGKSGREVVLALPFSRLIAKMVLVPSGEDPIAVATPILQALSPFPDEPLTVSCETVRESDSGTVVLAVAMPETPSDDLADALDAQKLQVTRIDALEVGLLRGLWSQLGGGEMRRLLVVRALDGISLLVLDGDQPQAIRFLSDATGLRRELMLLLLEAEDFGGARGLGEVVKVSVGESERLPAIEDDVLRGFGQLREIQVGEDAALVGVAERSTDPSALNALPQSWAGVLEESRFKRKLYGSLAVAGGIWLLIMAVLLGVPVVYGFMTDHQKALSKRHSRQYRAVERMREKVNLVRKYSDHANGALESMKKVSDNLPETGITLTSWSFKRDDSLRFTGEADTANLVYAFKDKMDDLFPAVELVGPSAIKNGKQKFDLVLNFRVPEDEQ